MRKSGNRLLVLGLAVPLAWSCSDDSSDGGSGDTEDSGGDSGDGGTDGGDSGDDGGSNDGSGSGADGGDGASAGDDGTGDGSDGGTNDGGTGGTDTGIPAECGNGTIDGDEACDDSNQTTEFPPYEATSCIDDCSLVLEKCGNGTVDPGEACDDGNDDSMDDCTTSCTVNDKGLHAPCTVEGGTATDVTSGTITGCENVVVPDNMELSCVRSNNFFNVTQVYAAEGDCQTIALKCGGGLGCPPDAGDYDADITCPDGGVLATKQVTSLVTVDSKVCQKACDTDADCRWNAYDAYWDAPGQYRCEVTDYSDGKRVCNDAQNNE